MYRTNKQEELERLINDLKKTIEKLVIDAAIAQAEASELREKLIETQVRNRKLDWLLTEMVERSK